MTNNLDWETQKVRFYVSEENTNDDTVFEEQNRIANFLEEQNIPYEKVTLSNFGESPNRKETHEVKVDEYNKYPQLHLANKIIHSFSELNQLYSTGQLKEITNQIAHENEKLKELTRNFNSKKFNDKMDFSFIIDSKLDDKKMPRKSFDDIDSEKNKEQENTGTRINEEDDSIHHKDHKMKNESFNSQEMNKEIEAKIIERGNKIRNATNGDEESHFDAGKIEKSKIYNEELTLTPPSTPESPHHPLPQNHTSLLHDGVVEKLNDELGKGLAASNSHLNHTEQRQPRKTSADDKENEFNMKDNSSDYCSLSSNSSSFSSLSAEINNLEDAMGLKTDQTHGEIKVPDAEVAAESSTVREKEEGKLNPPLIESKMTESKEPKDTKVSKDDTLSDSQHERNNLFPLHLEEPLSPIKIQLEPIENLNQDKDQVRVEGFPQQGQLSLPKPVHKEGLLEPQLKQGNFSPFHLEEPISPIKIHIEPIENLNLNLDQDRVEGSPQQAQLSLPEPPHQEELTEPQQRQDNFSPFHLEEPIPPIKIHIEPIENLNQDQDQDQGRVEGSPKQAQLSLPEPLHKEELPEPQHEQNKLSPFHLEEPLSPIKIHLESIENLIQDQDRVEGSPQQVQLSLPEPVHKERLIGSPEPRLITPPPELPLLGFAEKPALPDSKNEERNLTDSKPDLTNMDMKSLSEKKVSVNSFNDSRPSAPPPSPPSSEKEDNEIHTVSHPSAPPPPPPPPPPSKEEGHEVHRVQLKRMNHSSQDEMENERKKHEVTAYVESPSPTHPFSHFTPSPFPFPNTMANDFETASGLAQEAMKQRKKMFSNTPLSAKTIESEDEQEYMSASSELSSRPSPSSSENSPLCSVSVLKSEYQKRIQEENGEKVFRLDEEVMVKDSRRTEKEGFIPSLSVRVSEITKKFEPNAEETEVFSVKTKKINQVGEEERKEKGENGLWEFIHREEKGDEKKEEKDGNEKERLQRKEISPVTRFKVEELNGNDEEEEEEKGEVEEKGETGEGKIELEEKSDADRIIHLGSDSVRETGSVNEDKAAMVKIDNKPIIEIGGQDLEKPPTFSISPTQLEQTEKRAEPTTMSNVHDERSSEQGKHLPPFQRIHSQLSIESESDGGFEDEMEGTVQKLMHWTSKFLMLVLAGVALGVASDKMSNGRLNVTENAKKIISTGSRQFSRIGNAASEATRSALQVFKTEPASPKAEKTNEPRQKAYDDPRRPKKIKHVTDIEKGDTLWSLSQSLYGDPCMWPAIVDACKQEIGTDPRSILPSKNALKNILPSLASISEKQNLHLKGKERIDSHLVATKVKEGDTLFSICREIIGDGSKWPSIVAANPNVFLQHAEASHLVHDEHDDVFKNEKNPFLIYPGLMLNIPVPRID